MTYYKLRSYIMRPYIHVYTKICIYIYIDLPHSKWVPSREPYVFTVFAFMKWNFPEASAICDAALPGEKLGTFVTFVEVFGKGWEWVIFGGVDDGMGWWVPRLNIPPRRMWAVAAFTMLAKIQVSKDVSILTLGQENLVLFFLKRF